MCCSQMQDAAQNSHHWDLLCPPPLAPHKLCSQPSLLIKNLRNGTRRRSTAHSAVSTPTDAAPAGVGQLQAAVKACIKYVLVLQAAFAVSGAVLDIP